MFISLVVNYTYIHDKKSDLQLIATFNDRLATSKVCNVWPSTYTSRKKKTILSTDSESRDMLN